MIGLSADTSWRARARALARTLRDAGIIRDDAWEQAVAQTPRHVFAPCFYEQQAGQEWVLVDGVSPAERDRWLDAVYSDDTLDIQLGHVAVPLRMLVDLQVDDGHRVLEIGTGSGYNTALLCHRLGDQQVASVDLHPDLVASARVRLASLGHHPRLAAVDGTGDFPEHAPYDRIIATAAAAAVPAAWIDQTRPGGAVLVDVRGQLGGTVLRLVRTGPATLEGRFLDYPGYFMPLRADMHSPLRPGELPYLVTDVRDARTTETPVRPDDLVHPGLALVIHLHLPNLRSLARARDGSRTVYADDESWATVLPASAPGRPCSVAGAGPTDLWATVERAHDTWARHGRPGPTRLGLTVTPTAHRLWTDTPADVLAHLATRPPQ